jgi:uncharacterized protein (DUF2267 family)
VAPFAFADRASLLAEVRALRSQHNFSPDNAITAVATALWMNTDRQRFRRVLLSLPAEARDYWRVTGIDGMAD